MSNEVKKYRLLKDLPGLKAGTEFMQHPKAYNRWYPVNRFENNEHIDPNMSIYGFLRVDMDSVDWFEEVLPEQPNKQEGRIPPILGVTIKGNVVDYNESASFQMGEDGKPEIISMAGKIYYPTESCLNSKEKIIYDEFNAPPLYNQAAVDTIREDAFQAGGSTGNVGIFKRNRSISDMWSFPFYKDYLQSLSENKYSSQPISRETWKETEPTPTPQGSKEGWEIVTAKSKNGDIHDFIPEGNKKGSVPCFKMEEPCKAFSVRRISDNKVFSVGEDVFYINDIKEILSWSIREDGMIYAEMLEDIFFPITRLNKVLNNSNPQGSKEGWEVLTWFSREGEVAVLVGGEIEGNLKAGYTIRSVRRNSDGEVFTVGDKIGWGTDGSYETTLTGFEIQDGRLKFNDSERPEYCKWADFLNAVNLHKKLPIKEAAPQGKPLFTTEELLEAEHKAFYAAREYSDGKWSNQFPPPKLGEAKHATFSDYKESQKLNQ